MLNSEAVAEPVSASSGRIAPFGKYLLLQRVSVGGMAEVFKALPANATRIDQIVAIKRILPNIAKDAEFIGMFIDEARIAGQLTHPNICRIYELGRVGNDHYISMQFLWGRDLLKVMNRYKKAGRLVSPQMAAFIGAKALAALQYAHTAHDSRGRPLNIIHRDVSPQNIIVGYSGQVKLIDFGVARAASQSQKTQAGILKGKFGYMSPEMIRGLPIDHRSDVFAMGICLHELLTSARLFYGETDFATLELVRDAKVVPPSRKAPGVPPQLDAIVMRALSREVEDRFQSALEMQQALEDFISSYEPGYGQTDVGLAMRQAFHTEVQRERERLELFWGMLERGELVRGASVPALKQDASQSGVGGTPPYVGALIGGAEPSHELPPPPDLSQFNPADELHEEQTHIFFSASELDEIRDLDLGTPEQRARMQQPATLSDLVPPPPPEGEATIGAQPIAPQSMVASGKYQRSSRPPASLFDEGYDDPYARTSQSDAYAPIGSEPVSRSSIAPPVLPEGPPTRTRSKTTRYGVLGLVVATLGVAAYAVPRLVGGTGSLSIESVGDPDALVRVDGIVRGNPPIAVEGLAPGIHRVEVEAAGYEVARADVQVEQGTARAVRLVPKQSGPSVAPAPEGQAPAAPAPETTPIEATPPKPVVRERPRPKPKPAEGAAEEPAEEEASPAGSGEIQSGDAINPQMAAANEGELLITTQPWSHVIIDGQDTGRDTPVRALRVTAGPHHIGLRTDDGVVHEVDVVVKAGQTVRIIKRF